MEGLVKYLLSIRVSFQTPEVGVYLDPTPTRS